jgi:hypothetical protein
MEKSGALTTSVTVTVRVSVTPDPVIVRLYEPTGVEAAVLTNRLLVVVAGFGLNVKLAPFGKPDTVSET